MGHYECPGERVFHHKTEAFERVGKWNFYHKLVQEDSKQTVHRGAGRCKFKGDAAGGHPSSYFQPVSRCSMMQDPQPTGRRREALMVRKRKGAMVIFGQ